MKMRDEFGSSYSAGIGFSAPATAQPKAPAEELCVSGEYKIFVIVNGVDPDTQSSCPVVVRPFHLMPPGSVEKMLLLAKPCNDGKCAGIEIWPNGQTLMFSDERGVTVETFPVSELDPDVRDRLQQQASADPSTGNLWKKYLDAAAAVTPPEAKVSTGDILTVRKPITLKRMP
jgi:hypothetical protein